MENAFVLFGSVAASEDGEAIRVEISGDLGIIAVTVFLFIVILLIAIFRGRPPATSHRPFRGRYVYHGRGRRGGARPRDLARDGDRFGGGGASGSW